MPDGPRAENSGWHWKIFFPVVFLMDIVVIALRLAKTIRPGNRAGSMNGTNWLMKE